MNNKYIFKDKKNLLLVFIFTPSWIQIINVLSGEGINFHQLFRTLLGAVIFLVITTIGQFIYFYIQDKRPK
jgi:hypothetical protein